MKSKFYLWGLVLALILSLDSCKPKESAYKAAYEAAKARDAQSYEDETEEVTPIERPSYEYATKDYVQKEKVTVIGGGGIQQYSVVIGTFGLETNAVSLKNRMANQGYNSFLGLNARGMYRVIVATFSDKSSAVAEKNRIKDRFYPEFQDAWILDNQ